VRVRVFATSRYEREAKRLLAKAEIATMESAIAADPDAHPVVSGTEGVRIARWGREGKGKSGGVRVIYYYWLRDSEIYMLSIYAKNEQADMSAADKKAARKFVEALRNAKDKDTEYGQ
jgi:hypothetical protein